MKGNIMHCRRLVALAASSALLLAACGGDDASANSDTTTADTTTTEAPTETTAASSGGGEAGAIDPELVAAAEAEGTVTVYSFTSRIAAVEEAFEAAYPAIDLVGVDISSTEQIARIVAEVDAGNTAADVAYIADAPVVLTELLEGGYLEPYVPVSPGDALPAEYQEPLAAHRLSTKVLMYNEEANPDGPPVSNLWELTTEEWAGRVVMVDPLQRGDYLDLFTQIALADDQMAAAYEEAFGEPIDDPSGRCWRTTSCSPTTPTTSTPPSAPSGRRTRRWASRRTPIVATTRTRAGRCRRRATSSRRRASRIRRSWRRSRVLPTRMLPAS
jgi:iron(III) transport system substrate-binding protein